MRRAAIAGVVSALGVFLLLFLFKGLPYLQDGREAIDATPTVLPSADLAPVTVRPGQQACVSGITYGPQSRYVLVEVRSGGHPSPPIVVRASAPGYAATALHPGGIADNGLLIVPIRPASHAVGGGTLCLRNAGRVAIDFFGVPPGRSSSPSVTTVAGKPVTADLGVTLLASPNASIGSRLGDVFDHVAAFRPVTGWEVWILALLVVLGVPGGIAFALWRSTGAAPRE